MYDEFQGFQKKKRALIKGFLDLQPVKGSCSAIHIALAKLGVGGS